MSKKLILLWIATAWISCAVYSQQQDTTAAFQPLVCSGKIPADIITTSAEKYKREAASLLKKSGKKKESKSRRKFALESTFVMDNLLQSGRVLFNDEVSEYLNAVAQKLLAAKPMAKNQKVRVYALRSYAVNAFATDRGDVFVTLGLLAQLENEAQLAYILSHELTHVEKSHAMSFYLAADKIDRRKNSGVLNRTVTDDKLLAKCTFSKEQESEADRLGLERFLLTRYRTTTLPVVFDVLKYSYLPFDDQPFNRALLQTEHYHLPDAYWLEQVKPIEGAKDADDDSRDSHPNLKARREGMAKVLANRKDEGESDYLVSADRFERVRRQCRLELPMLYLHDDHLPQAIYATSLLLEKDPDNLWLQKCLLKGLYMNAKFWNDENYHFEGDYKEVEGESQQVYHLLEKMPAKETVVMALQYALRLQEKFPKDEEVNRMTADLFFELARTHDDLSKFSGNPASNLQDEPEPALPADALKPEQKTEKTASKYDKIRQKKEAGKTAGATVNDDYWQFAFVGQLDSETFQNQWKAAQKRKADYEAREQKLTTAKMKKALKRQKRRGLNLGIPKVVIVNPFYLKLDERRDNAVQYIATEKGQEHFRDLIREVGAKAELKTAFLDVSDLRETQTDAFNDIRFLNEWFAEQVHHYDLSLTPGYDQDRINAIAKKYGTDYFLWTGVVSLREKNRSGLYLIPASVFLFFPTLPLAIYAAAKPKYDMLHYAILYDVRTGKRQVLKFDEFKRRDADAVVKAHLYDTFSQIKRK